LPEIELIHVEDAGWWLVIEDVPNPLPRERWFCNSEMLSILSRLHALPLNVPAVFEPQWTTEMTDKALTCFQADIAERLRARLMALQEQHQHLFEAQCLISADPNPGNWGVRENGELVLFDWERFGYGTAAIDLAITVPGLGDREQFSQVAETYLRLREPVPSAASIERLSRDMAAAKLWTVIEYLSQTADGEIGDAAPVQWIVEQFEGWFEDLRL
jgi:thiamine kinase-like enzyme